MASKSPPSSLPVRGRAVGSLEKVASKRWRQLERVAQALRSLGDTPMTHARAERLAQRFGVHRATIYRYRSRLAEIDEATAIAGRTRGWKPLTSRLSAKQEQGIEEAINVLRKKHGPVRVVDLVEEVAARCRLLRVPCPSRPAIGRRLKRSSGLKVHRRGVAAPGNADPKISPGSFIVHRPLDVVQIDHTPMDIVVVDDLYRQPLGKPYLTLATDVATRCILGFVISFVPPGAGTVSLCMTLIVSPKAAWLKQLGVVGDWPMAGLPKTLHLDGAAEFKSKALKRGCGQYGVELVYRERTHHGGHIERLIGTKMGSRGGQHVRSFLRLPGTNDKPGWQGKLVADDFSGYKACFELGVTEVGCMAHARRKFHELWANHGSQVGEQALKFLSVLYDVEREVANADSQTRLQARRRSRPVADALHQWMRQQRQKVPDGSATARAIDYSLNRWVALTRFLDDGDLPIDNNWVENQIRPIAIGRNNWLFAGSLRAGKRAAAVMSLIHSVKLNGLDPYAYMRDVLERLPTQPASRIEELLPHRWHPTASA